MAQDSYADLVGVRVVLAGKTGPFRECPYCGAKSGLVAPGANGHHASVICPRGHHVSWLGIASLEALRAQFRGIAE